jgi:hypothetical protein
MLLTSAVNQTYGFPLADMIPDCPDRVIIQPKQRIRDEREHCVRARIKYILRAECGLNV